MVTRSLSAARSMSISLTPAWDSLFLSRHAASDPLGEAWRSLSPHTNATSTTCCRPAESRTDVFSDPMFLSLRFRFRHAGIEFDGHVTLSLENPKRAPHGLRAYALQGRTSVDEDLLDKEAIHIELIILILGVGDCRVQQLAQGVGRLISCSTTGCWPPPGRSFPRI